MLKLDSALDLLRERLEAGLPGGGPRRRPESLVVLASPNDGNAAKNRLVLTLAAVRPDPAARNRPGPGALEADLLVIANFPGEYRKALALLADALDWLHANPVLTGASGETVTVTMLSRSAEEVAATASLAGLPFAIYGLRGIGVG